MRSEQAATLSHDEIEAHLLSSGRDLERQLLQDHLDLRAMREALSGRRGYAPCWRVAAGGGRARRGFVHITGLSMSARQRVEPADERGVRGPVR
jgi:hypothetical protein